MDRPKAITRRTLVKRMALFAASASWFGRRESSLAFGEISPRAAAAPAGILKVSLADYPALQADYGSVRIGTSQIGRDNYPVGLFPPALINRAPGPIYYALNAACSHEGCIVPTLDPSSHLIQCRCHGSRYTISGGLVNGPAGFPLLSYDVRIQDGNLLISIEDLAFDVTLSRRSGSAKLELEFLAFKNISYQVWFRPSIQSEASVVPFAITEAGPEDQFEFPGIDDFAKIYVSPKGSAGFFEVAMKAGSV
jgi:Rieske Fe-S protein